MGNMVVYKNDLNSVPLRGFNSTEMDLFFGICSELHNKGLENITFSFEKIKSLTNYKATSINRLKKDLENIYDKLIKLNIKIGNENSFTKFVLFTEYSLSVDTKQMDISVNEKFKHILNEIYENFTKFELEEFVSLSSGYSKTAYRLLKQYRRSGYVIFKIEDFKNNFCIPKSYQMSDITKRVLEPITFELSQYFQNFEIRKVKAKKGRKIEYIEFLFENETDVKKDGKKTFREKNTKEYYEKDIMDFNEEEVNKTFIQPNILSEKIDKDRKELLKEWITLFPEDSEWALSELRKLK